MNMNTKLAVTLTAIIAIITSISSPVLAEDNSVVGEWVVATVTKGGLGATRTFDNNGTVVVSFGAALDMKYNLEANTIVMTEPDGALQRIDFAITKDTLTLTATNQPSQTLTRVKGTKGTGLIGKWAGKHYTGGQMFMEFTTKKNYYLSVPFRSETGSFVIEGDTLIEQFQNKERVWKWKIADGVLKLTDSTQNKEENYKRKE